MSQNRRRWLSRACKNSMLSMMISSKFTTNGEKIALPQLRPEIRAHAFHDSSRVALRDDFQRARDEKRSVYRTWDVQAEDGDVRI